MDEMDRLMVGFCTLCGQQYEKQTLDEKRSAHECVELSAVRSRESDSRS